MREEKKGDEEFEVNNYNIVDDNQNSLPPTWGETCAHSNQPFVGISTIAFFFYLSLL